MTAPCGVQISFFCFCCAVGLQACTDISVLPVHVSAKMFRHVLADVSGSSSAENGTLEPNPTGGQQGCVRPDFFQSAGRSSCFNQTRLTSLT